MISLAHYIVLGAVLFCIAVAGLFINRKNVIVLLMSIELMLLAVNMNFGLRVFHPHRGCGGSCCRPGDPGPAVPHAQHDQHC